MNINDEKALFRQYSQWADEIDPVFREGFIRDIPYWIDSGHFESIESTLNRLLHEKRFELHKQCLSALGDALFSSHNHDVFVMHARPVRYGERLYPLSFDNPAITPKDDMKLISTFLMMYPIGALQREGLLGESWAEGFNDKGNSDVTFLSIVIGLHRLCDVMGRARGEYEPSILSEHCEKLATSAGFRSMSDLVAKIPHPGSPSTKVSRLMKKLNKIDNSTLYNLSNIMQSSVSTRYGAEAIALQDDLFQLGMKYRLLELHCFSVDRQNTESGWFDRVAESPNAHLKTLRCQFEPGNVSQRSIDILHEKGKLKQVLMYKTEKSLQPLMNMGIDIPKTCLPKKGRCIALENDLGL